MGFRILQGGRTLNNALVRCCHMWFCRMDPAWSCAGHNSHSCTPKPPAPNSGLLFIPKLLQEEMRNRFPFMEEADMKCDCNVMSVRPGEGEVGEVCSQHHGATTLPQGFPLQLPSCCLCEWNCLMELPTAPADWLPLLGKLS